MWKSARRGQTAVEYVIVFCALVAVAGALVHLFRATRSGVVRAERLVGADYP